MSGEPAAGRRSFRGPLKFFIPALLALVVAVVVVALTGEDNSNEGSSDLSRQSRKAPATEASSNGTLRSAGTDLFAVGRGGLAELDGQEARGRGVTVQSIRPKGLWVGTGAAQRVFVRDRSTDGLQVGQRVDVRGTVRRVREGAGRSLGVSGQDLRDVEMQGGYIAAGSVKAAA